MTHKHRHFLGKEAPKAAYIAPAKTKRTSSTWMALLVIAPIFLGTSLVGLSESGGSFGKMASRTVSTACDTAVAKLKHDGNDIFPLFPAELRDYDETSTKCVPALWSKDVFSILIYKTLGLLNYIAGAAAVLATIYAGVLYLTSYASEANAKKAKTILIGTYVGFFLILAARIIVQSSFYLFGNGTNDIQTEIDKIIPSES